MNPSIYLFSAFQFSGNSTVKLVFKSLGSGRQVSNKIEDKEERQKERQPRK